MLVMRIPIRFQRRGGRKLIVGPDDSALMPRSNPQPDGALVKAPDGRKSIELIEAIYRSARTGERVALDG